uniref:Uncharacterized protein n=1 Tax=Anguilla anguilla TaxID=7936 RepID=A0A0E9QAY8_ANGAN
MASVSTGLFDHYNSWFINFKNLYNKQ